jgi:hypothetical protein
MLIRILVTRCQSASSRTSVFISPLEIMLGPIRNAETKQCGDNVFYSVHNQILPPLKKLIKHFFQQSQNNTWTKCFHNNNLMDKQNKQKSPGIPFHQQHCWNVINYFCVEDLPQNISTRMSTKCTLHNRKSLHSVFIFN